MRSRKQIQSETKYFGQGNRIQIELLLDIRDLLAEGKNIEYEEFEETERVPLRSQHFQEEIPDHEEQGDQLGTFEELSKTKGISDVDVVVSKKPPKTKRKYTRKKKK